MPVVGLISKLWFDSTLATCNTSWPASYAIPKCSPVSAGENAPPRAVAAPVSVSTVYTRLSVPTP